MILLQSVVEILAVTMAHTCAQHRPDRARITVMPVRGDPIGRDAGDHLGRPSVPTMMRHRPAGSLDPRARKDHLLMPMLQTAIDAETSAATGEGRRPTVVAAPVSVSPELSDRPRRRSFTAKDKLRILADVDQAVGTGGIGAVLRREGIYSSTLCDWRRQRDAGAFNALAPGKRGPKTAEPNPFAAEITLLRKNNARLEQRLSRAEAIIDIQKKVASLLGIPLPPNGDAL